MDGAIVAQKVESEKGNQRLQRRHARVRRPRQAGVIDPTKVVRTALENASSVATLLLTTNAAICEIPEEKKKKAGAGGHHHGGY